MDPISWSVIQRCDSQEVVLCVDFPVTGRAEAGFPDLAARMGAGSTFLQTVPPQVSPEARVSGETYIRSWVADVQSTGWPVSAVLGFCVGGVYAAAVAEAVAAWQQPPKVILFDPEYANVLGLSLELQRVLGEFGSLLSAEEIEQARKVAAELSETEKDDVGNFAARVVGLYREVGSAAFERVGLGDGRSNELLQLFETYMSWMSVADRIDPSDVWQHAVAISSNNPATLLHREQTEVQTGDLVGRQIHFDVAHADLLRSDLVAKTVLELLEF